MAAEYKEAQWATSGDVAWRAWVTAFYNVLVNSGWTQTADTGQANLATITYPAANAYTDYFIFRFNDALQATHPIFLKIEFSRLASASHPSLGITLSSSTNGAGTMSGTIYCSRLIDQGTQWAPPTTAPIGVMGCYNEATGCAWLMAGVGDSGGTIFWIARYADDDGTPNDLGLWTGRIIPFGTEQQSVRDFGSSTTRTPDGLYNTPVNQALATSFATNGTAPVWPVVGWSMSEGREYIVPGLVGCGRGDFGQGSKATINLTGTDRTYIAVHGTGTWSPRGFDSVGSNGSGLLAIWE